MPGSKKAYSLGRGFFRSKWYPWESAGWSSVRWFTPWVKIPVTGTVILAQEQLVPQASVVKTTVLANLLLDSAMPRLRCLFFCALCFFLTGLLVCFLATDLKTVGSQQGHSLFALMPLVMAPWLPARTICYLVPWSLITVCILLWHLMAVKIGKWELSLEWVQRRSSGLKDILHLKIKCSLW